MGWGGDCAWVRMMTINVMIDTLAPRTCSSSRESRYRCSPTDFWWMMPLLAMRWSESVVLPWSTWARMQILLHTGTSVWGLSGVRWGSSTAVEAPWSAREGG